MPIKHFCQIAIPNQVYDCIQIHTLYVFITDVYDPFNVFFILIVLNRVPGKLFNAVFNTLNVRTRDLTLSSWYATNISLGISSIYILLNIKTDY